MLSFSTQQFPRTTGDFVGRVGSSLETPQFVKNFRGTIENSEVFSTLGVVNYKNFYNTNFSGKALESTLLYYRFIKNFYAKNSKNVLGALEEQNTVENLWALNKNNNVTRIYPNLVKTLLSGNLLIGVKESEGGFNTNLVSLRDPM